MIWAAREGPSAHSLGPPHSDCPEPEAPLLLSSAGITFHDRSVAAAAPFANWGLLPQPQREEGIVEPVLKGKQCGGGDKNAKGKPGNETEP
jgi:hypothetical protein